jgi:hypothetical protein
MNDKWPEDYYYVGEEVQYNCSLCGWSEATIVEIQSSPSKVVVSHNGEKIGIYEDEKNRIDSREYYGN